MRHSSTENPNPNPFSLPFQPTNTNKPNHSHLRKSDSSQSSTIKNKTTSTNPNPNRFETVADERDTEEFDNWPTHAHIFESLREKPGVEVLIVAQENDNTRSRHFHVLMRMPENVC